MHTTVLSTSMGIVALGIAVAASGCAEGATASCGADAYEADGDCAPLRDGSAGSPGNGGNGGVAPECDPGHHEVDGQCVADAAGTDGMGDSMRAVGAACSDGAECEAGTCLPPSDTQPGGYCTLLNCDDSTPCPDGSACFFADSAGISLCMAQCDDGADCRDDDDYVCQPIAVEESICAASCTVSGACSGGTTCDASTGLCVVPACDAETSDDCEVAAPQPPAPASGCIEGVAETGWRSPGADEDDHGDWYYEGRARKSDNSDVTNGDQGEEADWYEFGLVVPEGSEVLGIEVAIEGQGNNHVFGVELSWDGGSTFTDTGNQHTWPSDNDSITTFGGAGDTWGRTWSVTELDDTWFRLKLEHIHDDDGTIHIDHIQVNVIYGCNE